MPELALLGARSTIQIQRAYKQYLLATAGPQRPGGQKLSLQLASAGHASRAHGGTLPFPEPGTRERAGPGTAGRRTRAGRGPKGGSRDGPPGRAGPRDRPGSRGRGAEPGTEPMFFSTTRQHALKNKKAAFRGEFHRA